MRLFYNKKTVKPSVKETEKIDRRLKEKYPQMYEAVVSKAEQDMMAGLSPGDKKEMERMIGKRLKAMYRK